jgi:succinate-semialdehyde dehydrogenase/glutarate-semialdehyde dehydrogenase
MFSIGPVQAFHKSRNILRQPGPTPGKETGEAVNISINPATGAEEARFPDQPDAEIDAGLDAAVAAQARWRDVPVQQRMQLLHRMAGVLRTRKQRYAGVISREMGKPLAEAVAEIEKCAWNCEFYAGKAPEYLADRPGETEMRSAVLFDPLGVVLAIMPWNYPFWQFFRFAAPALAAGNAIVLKHAANVPRCLLMLREAMAEAECPAGLFQGLFIATAKVGAVIADSRIAAVTLTGSTRVGAIVAAQAGQALKKQVLELGGSDPFIVLEDADIAKAARAAVTARYTNAGQSCINAKRFIVVDKIADDFIAAFVQQAGSLKTGDPFAPDTSMGPLARADLRDTLHDQVIRSLAMGAARRLGGMAIEGPGFFYAPTILDHVTADMAAFREETFGPVAAVIRARDAEDAIALANCTEFGLGASLWSGDSERARQLAHRIEAGAVFVNATTASDPRLPFGGIKQSGYGRELGDFGIREFVNIKTLVMA